MVTLTGTPDHEQIGRPYTMELLDPQDPEEKLKNLPARMDGNQRPRSVRFNPYLTSSFVMAGVELLVISGKKSFFNISIPYISVGFHARIRWTETVKIVGTTSSSLTLRSFLWLSLMPAHW